MRILGTQPLYIQGNNQHTTVYNNHRLRHTFLFGASGTGKSHNLIRGAIDDILAGHGVLFIDPHGTSIEELLYYIPPHRRPDVILFDATDYEYPIGYNILDTPIDRPQLTSLVVDTFRNQNKEMWGPYPELFATTGVLALLENKGTTLLDLKKLLTNKKYRNQILENVTDPIVKEFWKEDFNSFSTRDQQERPMSTINKLYPLLVDKRMANILGQKKSSFDLGEVIREKKILLCSFPFTELGEHNTKLLMNFLVSNLYSVAGDEPFYAYLDEAHLLSPFFKEVLTGIRKKKVAITAATQYLEQLTPELQQAVLNSIGTLVVFRGSKELAPYLGEDPSSLNGYQAIVRTPKDTDKLTMPPITATEYLSAPQRIRTLARHRYARKRRY